MARRGGTKFPLIVYQHLLGRWWSGVAGLGVAMLGLAYTEYIQPLSEFLPWRWQFLAAIGVLIILAGLFLLIIRQFAYVQAFPDHLKIVTPFMRVNISYKRLQKTTTAEMRQLFPRKGMSGWVWDIFEPLANKNAVIIELKGYPISPTILRLFLSRFFFKDKTPHFVLLVKDWMRFSSELDSMRTGMGIESTPSGASKKPKSSILSKLPQK
jgi:hypothetical protein